MTHYNTGILYTCICANCYIGNHTTSPYFIKMDSGKESLINILDLEVNMFKLYCIMNYQINLHTYCIHVNFEIYEMFWCDICLYFISLWFGLSFLHELLWILICFVIVLNVWPQFIVLFHWFIRQTPYVRRGQYYI